MVFWFGTSNRTEPMSVPNPVWITEQFVRLSCFLGLREFEMRGLSNHRLSCCVNTLLQTLNATWELADILEKWKPAGGRAEDNVPFQLKRVLKMMQEDLPHPAPHQDFLHCLDRNRIRLSTQHDADEVFLSILDFIQLQMDERTLALEIQSLYKISVETQVQCLQCNNVQTRNSHLLSLPLHIKEDRNSLKDCMISFFEQQELRGIDCCFCAQCEAKTPTKQGVKLCSLPQILCIQLKRFRNIHGFTHKLNCRVTFPEKINFSELQRETFSSGFTQNDCRYILYAVVVHSGGAMFGHYTAYVRHRVNHRWFYADDSRVSHSSWEDVQKTDGSSYRGTAYMLMYRKDPKEVDQLPDLSG
ncbi:ubl carboxyl-terminal hydrolase 18 [Poecilia reticulata]|uniref:ubl carboxyl-terminal hydrolase 18 n=1 Tax=Poecilia reticulata TaxID=8081 RepID=UPI0004A30506|nr:PREDICTED: ubl carboxyl-terminal hydrolase 18-like [Poecilia reticulata]